MCPDVPAHCPDPYTGDPIIYVQEAASLVWPIIPAFFIVGMILMVAVITWSVYEGTK